MLLKELKCPNCTAPVSIKGNLATCTRCSSNFLIDVPANVSIPNEGTKSSDQIGHTPQSHDHDVQARIKPAEKAQNTNVKLIPIAQKAINWTAIAGLTLIIWLAIIWLGFGVIALVVLIFSKQSYSSWISSFIMLVIIFGMPGYFVQLFAYRKRSALLETDSEIELVEDKVKSVSQPPQSTNQPIVVNIVHTAEKLEQNKPVAKQPKPTKRQLKSIRIPHGLFGKANTRGIERTSQKWMQKGYSLTHQNDQPARGCLGSGYTLLTFVKE